MEEIIPTKTKIISLTGVASEGVDSVAEAEGVVLENLSRFAFTFSHLKGLHQLKPFFQYQHHGTCMMILYLTTKLFAKFDELTYKQ